MSTTPKPITVKALLKDGWHETNNGYSKGRFSIRASEATWILEKDGKEIAAAGLFYMQQLNKHLS